jgi:hypothetical protein
MGLAEALHPGVTRLSKYGSNWRFLSNDKLKQLYTKIREILLNNEYGEYFAVQHLFGKDIAKELVRQGQVISPGNVS